MNKKNLLKVIIAVGASVVIATALFVNAGVGNPSASGKALPEKSNVSVADSNSMRTGLVESTKTASASTEPTFTLKQLKSFNGQNGQPAYIAYKGVVYDLTAVSNWSSGKHNGISAGTDVTEVFSSSPHAVSILKMGFVVGKLVSETATVLSANGVTPSTSGTAALTPGSVTGPQNAAGSGLKVFTLTELKTFNGLKGQPAYVAYKGIVYDLTAVGTWSNGQHHGVPAGTDITALFASSPHATSILSMGFVVGTLEGFTGTIPAQIAPSQSGTLSGAFSDEKDDDMDEAREIGEYDE